MNLKVMLDKSSHALTGGFRAVIRRLTAWAWKKEIAVCEGLVALKALDMDEHAMDLRIQQDPTLARWVAKCFASMVAASPNYTEMKFDLAGPYRGQWEWLTVHIQKGAGKTPHQLRLEAELELANFKAQLNPLTAAPCK